MNFHMTLPRDFFVDIYLQACVKPRGWTESVVWDLEQRAMRQMVRWWVKSIVASYRKKRREKTLSVFVADVFASMNLGEMGMLPGMQDMVFVAKDLLGDKITVLETEVLDAVEAYCMACPECGKEHEPPQSTTN